MKLNDETPLPTIAARWLGGDRFAVSLLPDISRSLSRQEVEWLHQQLQLALWSADNIGHAEE